ncbi:hypothetical protein H6P81_016245 [Aristolochia fimbriata]|uniref:LAGLIDADG homing endonuclease n=1 Tax=Aristolochia fimbriata TaxID=158543 RepID=A0AAV7E7Q2_ARIFI|nr:hypothetical protein H6P81_016245 [Aristolochia fimbriata]
MNGQRFVVGKAGRSKLKRLLVKNHKMEGKTCFKLYREEKGNMLKLLSQSRDKRSYIRFPGCKRVQRRQILAIIYLVVETEEPSFWKSLLETLKQFLRTNVRTERSSEVQNHSYQYANQDRSWIHIVRGDMASKKPGMI